MPSVFKTEELRHDLRRFRSREWRYYIPVSFLEIDLAMYTSEKEGAESDIEFFQNEIERLFPLLHYCTPAISLPFPSAKDTATLSSDCSCNCTNCCTTTTKIWKMQRDINVRRLNMQFLDQITYATSLLIGIKKSAHPNLRNADDMAPKIVDDNNAEYNTVDAFFSVP